MKLLPAECVVVEDAPAGIAAARAAGASAAVVLLHRRGTGTAQKHFCELQPFLDGCHPHAPALELYARALAAGMRVVGVTTMLPASQMTAHSPDLVCSDIGSLKAAELAGLAG